jgi:NhaA family Na+:H+ antiporter
MQPPGSWEPLLRLARLVTRPLERFLRIEAASGIVLLAASAAAFAWANSPWAPLYGALWHTPLGLRVGALSFQRSLEWFVNDGLMVIFFFVVGMEIRRELHHGELSHWRRAALPAAAALGGMLVPAAIYFAIAGGSRTGSGWGVPMATDIAFAIGILALLGRRVPASLRVLLLALAVIDDLGAIIVIALFYSSGVALQGLLVAAAGFGGVFVLQRFGVRARALYLLPALIAWAGIYTAGIHPTIAGVILGLMTPVRAWFGQQGLLVGVRGELQTLAKAGTQPLPTRKLAETLHRIEVARREAISPAEDLIEKLQPWVAYVIMPVFALANAGVSVVGGEREPDSWRVMIGAAVGLVVGKPLGVFAASWVALRLRLATIPSGLTLRHLAVLGVVAGVGFTMSLFIAQLALPAGDLLAGAKLGILVASAVASTLGLLLGWIFLARATRRVAKVTADEAEATPQP